MATLKWPSIAERRSPTETTSNRIDLDRSGIPNNGSIKLTIQIPRNWTTQKVGLHPWLAYRPTAHRQSWPQHTKWQAYDWCVSAVASVITMELGFPTVDWGKIDASMTCKFSAPRTNAFLSTGDRSLEPIAHVPRQWKSVCA